MLYSCRLCWKHRLPSDTKWPVFIQLHSTTYTGLSVHQWRCVKWPLSCMHTHTLTHTRTCTHTLTHTRTCTHTHVHSHSHTHLTSQAANTCSWGTHTHTHTHTHSHSHTPSTSSRLCPSRSRRRGCVSVRRPLWRGWSRTSRALSSSRTLWSSGPRGWRVL